MKLFNIYITTIALIFINSFSIYAQESQIDINGYSIINTNLVEQGDTVEIALENYRGTIQWQESNDGENWSNLLGETSPILEKIVDSLTYFRAVISEEDCEPFFTEPIAISTYTYKTGVIILDTTKTYLISDSIQMHNSIYNYTNTDTFTFNVGDVFVSAQGEGHMRKIESISSQTTNSFTVETSQATFEDIFEYLDLKSTIQVLIDEMGKSAEDANASPIQFYDLKEGVTPKSGSFGLDFSNTVLYDGNTGLGDLKATITNGEIYFEPTINFDLQLRPFLTGVKEVYLTAEGEIGFDCELLVELSDALDYDREIKVGSAVLGVVMAGPVPLTTTIDFYAGFELEAQYSGEASFGFNSNYGVEFGAHYIDQQWNPVWNRGGEFVPIPFQWDASASLMAKAYIKPKLSMKIASLAGPYLDTKPYVKIEANANFSANEWDWALKGGVGANLGFQMSFLGFSLADYNTELLNWETTFASDNGSIVSQGPIADFSVSNAVVNEGQSLNFFDESTGNPTTWNWTFDGATPSSSNQQNPSGIVYNTIGTYDVSLTVSNNNGSDTKELNGYINVIPSGVPVISISTSNVTDITINSAVCGGQIDSDGGDPITQRGVCWSTNPSPTLSDNFTTDGTGVGSFTSNIEGLSENTTYYVRAYALNNASIAYGNEVSFSTGENIDSSWLNPNLVYGSVIDNDGNEYATIEIGTQTWMAENLKTTRFNNGDLIQNNTSIEDWSSLSNPVWAYYENNQSYKTPYGLLYSRLVIIDSRNICPIGWHLPSDTEWNVLRDFLDPDVTSFPDILNNSAKKMKTEGHFYWQQLGMNPSDANNESGFSALPGGYIGNSVFIDIGQRGYWWSNSVSGNNSVWTRSISYTSNTLDRTYAQGYDNGYSIRCIKD